MNIEIKRKPRPEPTISDLDYTPFSKYKHLTFKTTNFLEVTTLEFLIENCLYELETAYKVLADNPKEKELYFKQAENSKIIQELAKLKELVPSFTLAGGRIKYYNVESECDHEVFDINVTEEKVTVLI